MGATQVSLVLGRLCHCWLRVLGLIVGLDANVVLADQVFTHPSAFLFDTGFLHFLLVLVAAIVDFIVDIVVILPILWVTSKRRFWPLGRPLIRRPLSVLRLPLVCLIVLE